MTTKFGQTLVSDIQGRLVTTTILTEQSEAPTSLGNPNRSRHAQIQELANEEIYRRVTANGDDQSAPAFCYTCNECGETFTEGDYDDAEQAAIDCCYRYFCKECGNVWALHEYSGDHDAARSDAAYCCAPICSDCDEPRLVEAACEKCGSDQPWKEDDEDDEDNE